MPHSGPDAQRRRHLVAALRLFGEERFIVIGIDFEAGRITHVADPMPEAALRAHLARSGTSPGDVDALIREARASRGGAGARIA